MKNAEKFALLGVFLSTFQTFYTHLKTNIIVVPFLCAQKSRRRSNARVELQNAQLYYDRNLYKSYVYVEIF